MALFIACLLSILLLVLLLDAGLPDVEVPYGTGEIDTGFYRGHVLQAQYNMFRDETTLFLPEGWSPIGTGWRRDADDGRFFRYRGNPVTAVLSAGGDRLIVVRERGEMAVIMDSVPKKSPVITSADDDDDFF